MWNRIVMLFMCLHFLSCEQQEDTLTIPGVTRIDHFKSEYVQSRNIDILLPKQYDKNKNQKFPVLYVNDGQMIFDKRLNENNQSWQLDSIAQQLIKNKEIEPLIIVAIWSTENRWEEYMPEDVIELLDPSNVKTKYASIQSNNYLKFLTTELKPYIDKNYRTRTDKKSTTIMGSSMGGLISWYALFKYPEVFGNAICISTHWPAVEIEYKHPLPKAIKKYFEEHLPKPGTNKLYFDFGTEGLDQYYQAHQWTIDEILTEKRWVSRKDFVTLMFKGHGHDENYWRDRVHFSLLFLYKHTGEAM